MNFPTERRRTLWVVDDSPTDAERVKRLFSSELEVCVFSDGAAALESLSSGKIPDLLLLDWVMPGMTGIEVCQYIRKSSSEFRHIPIILLTARYGAQEVYEAFTSGANDYVSKPFIEEELSARVNSLLQAKQLLNRAEKAEADVKSLLASAPDPIFAIDAQAKVVFVNEEGVKALRLTKEKILGQPFTELVPSMTRRHIGLAPGESLLPNSDVFIAEKVFSPSIRALPSDSAAMTTIVLRDVTDRRESDTKRLDFYSVIAHDLRTPITSTLLRLDLAFRGKRGILPAEHLLDLRKIETSLKSLSSMINDFLELASLEGVGYKIDRNPVNLGELIKTTVDDFQPLIEKNGLKLILSGVDATESVVGDAQRLAQVVANLVGNAIKFTPGPGTIAVSVSSSHQAIEVSVTDTGRGIAKQDLGDIFNRYTRSKSSSKETAGTGLGLMIVREIVEAHNGAFGVESEMGRGSKFWFKIPLE